MTKGRLEAFSDGVIAILITIMVLELAQPEGASLRDLLHQWPHIAIYGLSFVGLGIYWNNHHHLFHIVDKINGRVLWANLHLLFWLSLVPYVTAWVGEQGLQPVPVAVYAFVHLLAGIGYFLWGARSSAPTARARKLPRRSAVTSRARSRSRSTRWRLGWRAVWPPLTIGFCTVVALMWFVPDRRFEAQA